MKPFAFVFPGQGSQSVGMLDGWGDHPEVAATLREASDALGEDVGRLIHDGPKESLALTTNTQPVMLVAGVAVNFNDPAQTVIAGSKAAVEKACEVLKSMGAKRALPLPVSAPFHSSLMKPAAETLKARLAETPFAGPRIPVVNNIEVKVESEPDRIRGALYEQAFGPVRWVECVQAIKARGATTLVECGPAKVTQALSGFQGCKGAVLNVNDAAAAEALVDSITKEYGGLQILVNNAGITRDMLAMRLKDEDWDAVLDTNLKAVFRMSRAVMR